MIIVLLAHFSQVLNINDWKYLISDKFPGHDFSIKVKNVDTITKTAIVYKANVLIDDENYCLHLFEDDNPSAKHLKHIYSGECY